MINSKSSESVRDGLALIRRRRLLAHGPFGAFVALTFVPVLIQSVSPRFGQAIRESDLFRFAAFAGWCFAMYGILFVRVVTLKRPRCHQPFHAGRYRNDARKCLNCGLHLDCSNA